MEVGIGKGRFLLAAAEARPDSRFLGLEWANKYLRFAEARAVRRGSEERSLRPRRRPRAGLPRGPLGKRCPPTTSSIPTPGPRSGTRNGASSVPETVDHLARTLVPGGLLHVATDHAEYWEALHPLIDAHASFERLPRFGDGDFPLDPEAQLTNFEVKYAKEGRQRHRGSWRRVAG